MARCLADRGSPASPAISPWPIDPSPSRNDNPDDFSEDLVINGRREMVPQVRDSSMFRRQSSSTGQSGAPLPRPRESRRFPPAVWFFSLTSTLLVIGTTSGSADTSYLADGWAIQSSAKVPAGGATISSPAFKPSGWHKATVPSTVVGNLVEDGVYSNPFLGMNLRSLPGMTYPIGANFSHIPLSADGCDRPSAKEFREIRAFSAAGVA